MWLKNILLFVVVIMSPNKVVIAQQIPAKKDTTRLYLEIESYSNQGKFTRLIFGHVFKSTATSLKKRERYKKLIIKPYSAFEGKIIRQINIVTLDPFGYSIGDTILATKNFIAKTGNNLHIKSLPITIRNLLLIGKNQMFDSLLVKESERLIRSRAYLRDVSFCVKAAALNSDSVDIFIRALDIWSINPTGSVSNSGITVGLTRISWVWVIPFKMFMRVIMSKASILF